MSANPQYIRFQKPQPPKEQPKPSRHSGLLQDQLRRSAKAPWCPSFSLAVRMFLLFRISGAMYSNLADCDEVFNYWEPLHYLHNGYGFQTWEVSPTYAIRSWTYIVLHELLILPGKFFSIDKRQSFFLLRILLAVACTMCEVKLYRAVVEKVNYRVGRYLLFMLLFSTGSWNVATAFLPSSFAYYANTLAFAYALETPSSQNAKRTLVATVLFAAGAIIGWPFSLALAIPFVIEELCVFAGDRVPAADKSRWQRNRFIRLVRSGCIASLLFIPVVGIDSLAYGKLTVVPWNIIRYNIFGGQDRGPDLYGTEPWYFYVLNLTLNFNVLFPLALASVPALLISARYDRRRLGALANTPTDQSSPVTLLLLRVAPFYIWFGILTLQPHKEERFMFPAYSMLTFNAAVTLYLVRGWMEVIFIKATSSPYRASKTSIFSRTTLVVVLASMLISGSRILAVRLYYHTPQEVIFKFASVELPRVLNVTGLLLPDPRARNAEEALRNINLSPIKELNLTLCIGKEWYRFPGHWLVPDGIHVDFIKSEFDGLLPRHFEPSPPATGIWPREATRNTPMGLNDLNKEEPSHYVDISTCHYLIDLDFPEHPVSSPHEPRYAVDDKHWERVYCAPFLDAAHSSSLTRMLWLPGQWWQSTNSFGDYCLLKKAGLFP